MFAGWLASDISRYAGAGQGREQQLYILKDQEICLLPILKKSIRFSKENSLQKIKGSFHYMETLD